MPAIRPTLALTWICLIGLFPIPATADDILAEWTYVGNDDWTNAANWNDGLAPVSSQTDRYHVVINNTSAPSEYIQCSLRQSMSVSELTLGNVLYVYGGTDEAPQQFEVQDHFRWVGGALSGWGSTYHLRGDAVFEGETHKTLDRTCSLYIHGHARWTGGHLTWGGYGHAAVESGALFELNTGGTVGSSITISNRGTILMYAPGKTARLNSSFVNDGAIEVQAGDLQFMHDYQGTGAVSVASDTRLIVSHHGLWQPFPYSGDGEIILEGLQEILADMLFPGRLTIKASVVGGGSLSLKDAVWEAGDLSGTGALIVPTNGHLRVRNQGQRLQRALINSGEVTLEPGALIYGHPGIQYQHENSIEATLTLGATSAFGVSGAPAGSFVNRGTIQGDAVGVGNAQFHSVLSNLGLVRSTRGRLGLVAGGTNFATFEAIAPGSIRAQGFHFPESSVLLGDGAIEVWGGTFLGQVSSNLALSASGVNFLREQPYDLRQFQVSTWVRFQSAGGVQARESLRLSGSLYGGHVHSLSNAEISVTTAEIRDGAEFELGGTTAFAQGTLTITKTNSSFINRGTLYVLGSARMNIDPGAIFLNEGNCAFNRQIGSLKASVSDVASSWSAGDLSGETTPENGPFEISGPVAWAPRQISAGPAARLVFSDLAVTNAEVRLLQSTLEVQTSLTGSGALFILDDGNLIAPEAACSGDVALMGHGTVQATLGMRSLQLQATPASNHIVLQGGLSFTGGAPVFGVVAIQSNAVPVFPFLQVAGPVELAGTFQLTPQFLPTGSNFVSGPVTLLESDQPLAGTFDNVHNGDLIVASNGFRWRVFYGDDSPYGPDRLVVAEFGSAFDQWRFVRFTTEELADATVAGLGADPDGNGFSNVSDFVFALDQPGRGVTLLPPGVDGYSTLRLCRRKDVGGLHARIGVSSNLRQWSETTLGGSVSQLILHRVFELEDCCEYHYLIPGAPEALYVRLVAEGEW